jgi:hypothetical protein
MGSQGIETLKQTLRGSLIQKDRTIRITRKPANSLPLSLSQGDATKAVEKKDEMPRQIGETKCNVGSFC